MAAGTGHNNVAFCLARVEEARAEADATSLDNVRQQKLQSMAAWQAMADRAVRIKRERNAREGIPAD